MAVRIFKSARARLIEVWNYSERTWGVAQADKYLQGLVTAMEAVQSEPHRWRPLRHEGLPGVFFVTVIGAGAPFGQGFGRRCYLDDAPCVITVAT